MRRLRSRRYTRRHRLSWRQEKRVYRKARVDMPASAMRSRFWLMITRKQFVDVKSGIPVKRDTRPKRKRSRRVLLIAGLCLLAIGIVGSAIGYPALSRRYRQDMARTHTGAQELKEGIDL